MTEQLKLLAAAIVPTDAAAQQAAQQRLDSLIKPPGSLGGLEQMAVRLAGITGKVHNTLPQRRVVVFAADNGVVAEGVSSAPQVVTASQTINMLRGVTGVAVLAAQYGSGLEVIDVGIACDPVHPALLRQKVRYSTGNIVREPAMTREEALAALEVGAQAARRAAQQGICILGVGEMGIGNTTTSTAVLAALLGLPPNALETICGRGAGLTDEGYATKLRVLRTALALHAPQSNDTIGVLAAVGGLDIAAMAGAFLGAAASRLPVVVDGYISAVAALCAVRLAPNTAGYLFASHASHERGYSYAMQALGIAPCLHLGMRLGEGSGCPVLFSILDGACAIINNMATFAEGGIDERYLETINTPAAF